MLQHTQHLLKKLKTDNNIPPYRSQYAFYPPIISGLYPPIYLDCIPHYIWIISAYIPHNPPPFWLVAVIETKHKCVLRTKYQQVFAHLQELQIIGQAFFFFSNIWLLMRSLHKRRLMSIFRQQVGTLFCIHMFWTLYVYLDLYLHVHFPYRDNLSRICLCLIAQKNIFIPMCGLCICISVFICIYMSTCPYIDNFPRICLCLLAQKNISHSHVVDFGGGAHSVFSWQPQFWQFNDFRHMCIASGERQNPGAKKFGHCPHMSSMH